MNDPAHLIAYNRSRYGTYSWKGQALQYDQRGPAGEIVYQRFGEGKLFSDGPGPIGMVLIDTLLSYDERGLLAGILNYYPQDIFNPDGTQLEKAGNVCLTLRPDHELGCSTWVATGLVDEAERRWQINPEAQVTVWKSGVPVATTMGSIGDGGHRSSAHQR